MHKLSFRTRLTLIFGVVFLTLTLAASVAIDQLVGSKIVYNNGDSLHSLAFGIARAIANNLEEREREVRLMASSKTFTLQELDPPEIRANLDIAKRTYAYYAWIGIAGLDGTIVSSANAVLQGQSASARPWFNEGRKGIYVGDIHKAVLLAKVLGEDEKKNPLRFIDFAAPLHDQDGHLRGVLATHVLWNWVQDIINSLLSKADAEAGLQVFVVDAGNNVISPLNAVGTIKLPGTTIDENTFETATWPDHIAYQYADVRVVAKTSLNLGWRIVVRRPLVSVNEPVRRLNFIVMQISLIAFIALFAIAYWLARGISQPLEQLSQSASRITAGDTSAQLEVNSATPELQGLSTALRTMTTTLLQHQSELEQLNSNLEHMVDARTTELRLANAALAEKADALNQMARTDQLTGIANRRAASEYLLQLWELQRRNAIHYCVMLIDIDYFKKVNDNYGHDKGDLVLQHAARLLAGNARKTDFVARFGGEEFLVCMPGTDVDGAYILAEKMRIAIAAMPIEVVGHITISLGIAQCRDQDYNETDVVTRADHALYEAKRSGRNRTCVHGDA